MNQRTEDGGPAFPAIEKGLLINPGGDVVEPLEISRSFGMSLRDYFAGQAACGCLDDVRKFGGDEVAEVCYEIADAMIKERVQ